MNVFSLGNLTTLMEWLNGDRAEQATTDWHFGSTMKTRLRLAKATGYLPDPS
jgi:hypothetical protein